MLFLLFVGKKSVLFPVAAAANGGDSLAVEIRMLLQKNGQTEREKWKKGSRIVCGTAVFREAYNQHWLRFALYNCCLPPATTVGCRKVEMVRHSNSLFVRTDWRLLQKLALRKARGKFKSTLRFASVSVCYV